MKPQNTETEEVALDTPPQHQDQQPGIEKEMNPRPLYIREGYTGSGKLRGKAALITGGDSGIGRAVAVHFAREGADIAIVYKYEQEDAEETCRLVIAEGRRCILIMGDLQDEGFCQEAVEQAVEGLKRLDVLVNNAAQHYPKEDLREISRDQLEETFRVNVFSFFYITQAALNHMKPGGTIINTSSVTAFQGSPMLMDYASTKGAILVYTRSLAASLVEKGIRVNAVAPGPIWTPLIPASMPDDKVAKFGQDTPMKRAGQPAEVAPAYVYLACEDSSYVTGEVINVNGGDPF